MDCEFRNISSYLYDGICYVLLNVVKPSMCKRVGNKVIGEVCFTYLAIILQSFNFRDFII